jgi:hypothetical protein
LEVKTFLGHLGAFLSRHGKHRVSFFNNRKTPTFENRSACGTRGITLRETTGWFFFGGISRQRKN